MLKLSLTLLALLGTCTAQNQHPIAELQGTARVLIVFAPDSNNSAFSQQLKLIERHSYELTRWNTVVVPVSTSTPADEAFAFENLPLGTAIEQSDARTRFHVRPGEFLVILLNQDGTEQIRSASPVDIHELVASLEPPRLH